MGRTEDARIEELETILARMMIARRELEIAMFKVGQMKDRAPFVDRLGDSACGAIALALAQIVEQWEETKAKRNGRN